jgi:AbrB family looped-hinge helix DNA binding protein
LLFCNAWAIFLNGRKSEILLSEDEMISTTVQIRRKGIITLPVEWRRQYSLGEGDVFTLIDLGDGSFLLTPQVSRVTHLGGQVAQAMAEEGVTLEEMLEILDREREVYYRKHYVQD